jgi:hypothetical protein
LDHSSDCASILLHSSTAFPAARWWDYSSDCASLFFHSLTAFAAARASDYSSNCASLFLHSSTAFPTLVDGFPYTRRRLSRRHARWITRRITHRIGHLLVREFSHFFCLDMVLLTFYAAQFSSMAFPPNGASFLSNLAGLHIRLLVGLRVSFIALVDGFRVGSLVGVLARLRVSFLTLVDGLRSGSRVGFLFSFLTPVDGVPGDSLVRVLVDDISVTRHCHRDISG